MQVVGCVIRKARNKYFSKFDRDDNECWFYVMCYNIDMCMIKKKKKKESKFSSIMLLKLWWKLLIDVWLILIEFDCDEY